MTQIGMANVMMKVIPKLEQDFKDFNIKMHDGFVHAEQYDGLDPKTNFIYSAGSVNFVELWKPRLFRERVRINIEDQTGQFILDELRRHIRIFIDS